MNKKKIIILGFAFILLMVAATYMYSGLKNTVTSEAQQIVKEPAAEGKEPEKMKAPHFTVYDRDGKKVRFAEFEGKPIVLNFWAGWCGPCRMEMPDFNEKYLEKGKEINFLMVNMTDGSRETVEKAHKLVSEKGYSFPVFYDKDMDAARSYGVSSLPTTYFIDREGYITARAMGAIDGETLQRGIEMIISY